MHSLQHKRSRSHAGMSLAEVMIALGVGAFVVMVLWTQMGHIFGVIDAVEARSEARRISVRLAKDVSCEHTLEPYTTNGVVSVPINTPVLLRSKKNTVLTKEAGPASTPLAGGVRLSGNWYVQSLWDGSSISVAIAKANSEGDGFDVDQLFKQDLGFDLERHQLFSNSAIPLCRGVSRPSFFIKNEFFRSNQILSALSLNPPSGRRTVKTLINMFSRLPTGCHRGCETRGYRAGWPLEYSDEVWYYDAFGSFVGAVNHPDGQSVIICSCVK